jgi:2,3-dihydroxy-p-cumate/2,3-dihydroxybenzoate 3,4-dioxygenase
MSRDSMSPGLAGSGSPTMRTLMITLTDIAYIRSGVADLEGAVEFATGIVGLELAEATEPGVAHLRADSRHHCLALVEGPSGVIASGFTVADEDALTAAETELERSGITVSRGSREAARSRRVRSYIAFDDPFGNRLELATGQETLARPVAFSRAAGITEFGHLCLDAPDVREAYRFWNGHFNARVSDWIGDAACLMRIDPVHHKLAVFQGDEPGLCHMNFQVDTVDDIFRNWHFLEERGVRIEQGPGRHPQSTAVFLYFLGPEGFTYEYSFGVRRIEDENSWVPRTFDPSEPGSIDMWLGPVKRVSTQTQLRADTAVAR